MTLPWNYAISVIKDLILTPGNIATVLIGIVVTYFCYKKYKKTKSRPLLTGLPGVWTSLGLLGTFLAICIALYDLGGDLDILEIINKIIPAFTTSIIGLLGALVVTLLSKNKLAQEEHEENSKLENTSPEEYIRDIAICSKEMTQNKAILNKHNDLLTELINFLKETEEKTSKEMADNKAILNKHNDLLTKLIKVNKTEEQINRIYSDKLNNNISHQSEILKEFIDGFVKRMDDIFKQMHNNIQQQVQDFGEEQFAKTSQILTSITERLSSVSNEIINNQRQSVKTMMNNTNAEIGNITTSVTEVLGNLTSKVQESLATLNTQQSERLNTIITNYDALATQLSEQNKDFANKVTEQMQTEYSRIQEHNEQSLQQMVDLKKSYQEVTSDVLTSTLAMNEKATSDLRESMSGFVTDIQSLVATQCTTLSDAITKNVESLNDAYQFIENLVAEIRQNYEQAVLSYSDAVKVAHRTNESSEKAINANNESLQAVEKTNKKISEILDILENRQENIEQLTKRISSVSGAIVELQKLESTLNKITNSK